MTSTCKLVGCTFDETGRCALERAPAECSNRTLAGTPAANAATEPSSPPEAGTDQPGAPVLGSPERLPSFPASTTLGSATIGNMMLSRYVTVVGILGDPESGKTACLVSLYLLVSNGKLEGWSFADSRSLVGFEDIARGAREWNKGHPPEQLTLHTELADDRQPGFLHLRLRRNSDGRRIDLALPDLPGEWTDDLVTSARTDRFEFMKAAETVWLVVDGRDLVDRSKRQTTITRLGQLSGRLRAMTLATMPRTLVVVTHRDGGALSKDLHTRVLAELAKHDVVAEILEVAPFSSTEHCKPGFGIKELVEATIHGDPVAPPFWASTPPKSSQRAYIAYRRDR